MKEILKRRRSITTMSILGFLTLILAFGTTWANDKDKLMGELREIELRASSISDYATELEFMVNRPYSAWYNHERELSLIQENVNEIGDEFPALTSLDFDQEWKEEVVERIAAHTEAMAANVEKAIKYFNNHTNRVDLQSDEFTTHVAAINRFAQEIDDLVDYVQTRTSMKEMRENVTS